jgi:hypothetical protein
MVILENKDTYIFNLPEKIADIIYQYNSCGNVTITTNSEGLCLRSANFYSTLDYVCDKFKFNKKLVTILTCNVEEFHSEYNIKILRNHWIDECKNYFGLPLLEKKENIKTVGCFLGKPNWHRLALAAWLNAFYSTQTLLTCHYDPIQERHAIDSELTKLNQLAANELPLVIPFLKKCPIISDEGFLNYTIGPPTHYNILSKYSNLFLDLVVETYITGTSFFPTEKTLRPIIAKTPFIIMGPQGYLANMQRIGFKTFSNWWDEDYDNFSEYQRLIEIKKIVTKIFTWSDVKLHNTLNEMSEILEYNRLLLRQMDGGDVKLSQ